MDFAAGELPDQPGVNGTEEQLAGIGPLSGPGHIVQQPFDLGAGEIGVRLQAGLMTDGVAIAPLHQVVNDIGGTAALPDDGVGNGFPGRFVPDDCGFPLVGDADGGDVRRLYPQLGHGSPGDFQCGVPDLIGVMLHPAGMGINLPELLLYRGTDISGLVEQYTAAAGRPLVKGHDIFHKYGSF